MIQHCDENKPTNTTALEYPDVPSLYAAIACGARDAIISTSLSGLIESWNDGAELLYGYSPQETMGNTIDMLLVPDHREDLQNMLQHIAEDRTIEHAEINCVRKNGTLITVSAAVSAIKAKNGQVVGISMIGRDTTKRRNWEDSLVDQIQNLQESNRALSRLGHVLSHDLRSPVHTIVSFAQILSDDYAGRLDADGNKYLRHILEGAQRLDSMIKGLVDSADI